MTTYQSNIAQVQAVRSTNAAAKLMPTDAGGRVRIATGKYVGIGTEAAGSVVNLAMLPAGARLLPSSKLYFEAGQAAGLSVKVGDSANDARYLVGITPGVSATTKGLDANALGSYVLAEAGFVALTTSGAALAAGKTIAFEIYYVID